MNAQPTKNGNGRAWDLFIKIAAPVAVLGLCAAASAIVGLAVLDAKAATKDELHEVERRLANPPDWLREDVREIKSTLKEMDARLRDHLEEHHK